jgi:hypothetical protein
MFHSSMMPAPAASRKSSIAKPGQPVIGDEEIDTTDSKNHNNKDAESAENAENAERSA